MPVAAPAQPITIEIDSTQSVSGRLLTPSNATAAYVMAHGAGAGMDHSFMAAVAAGLSDRGIATLRFQFVSMERGSKRPDSPALAHAAVRAAVDAARGLMPSLPLLAGGKSFGGRMTSQAQASAPLPGVIGLVFFGFPLHPVGKPSDDRAKHLADVDVPMLFLQGTNDKLAEMPLLEPLVQRLGSNATLERYEGADHSFHVPARSGRSDAQVRDAMLDAMAAWIARIAASSAAPARATSAGR